MEATSAGSRDVTAPGAQQPPPIRGENQEQQILPGVSEYPPQAVVACEKALRTVLARIGPWGSQLVLIGGMAPKYLISSVPEGIDPHVGTTDLDVVIGITLQTDEQEAYRTLQKNLTESGFAESRDPDTGKDVSFRWERVVDGIHVTLEFFCPVGEGEPGKLLRSPSGGVGSRISAIRTRGAELLGHDNVTVLLEGELLDGGGIRENVSVKVANLLPWLVLKAFALQERTKDKDAYDVVWTLNAYREGPESAAEATLQSPVAADAVVRDGIDALRASFRTENHSGAASYARFFGVSDDEEQPTRLARFAHATVERFLRVWDASQNVRTES